MPVTINIHHSLFAHLQPRCSLLCSPTNSAVFPLLTRHNSQLPHIHTYTYIKHHQPIDWLIPKQDWIPYPHLSDSKGSAPPRSWLTLSPVISSFFLCPNCKSMLFPQLPLPVCQVPSLSFKPLLKTHFFWFDFRH